MKKYLTVLSFLAAAALLAGALAWALHDNKEGPTEEYNTIARPAQICPDYRDTVIPPNIAAMNFFVQEKGSRYYVKIYSERGQPIEVFSKSGKIIIPQGHWRNLLNNNKDQKLYFDIFVKTNGQWTRFDTFTNKIVSEPIDSFVVYRKMRPAYATTTEMAINQRNLENYNESVVLHSKSFGRGTCFNCHTFLEDSRNTLIHTRSRKGPSLLLVKNGQVSNIDSRTPFGSAPMGHSAWHPSGKVLVFTVYSKSQFFHSARNAVRDGMDLDSAMGYYLFESKESKTNANISQPDRLETYPTWSPDGKYLYYCSAPKLWSDQHERPPVRYQQVKYDLVRVSYDVDRDQWGQPQIVISAADTGLSTILPRISPDGRWLMVCMCEYGQSGGFAISSDLYLVDLNAAEQTGRYEYRRLDINSDQSDYWKSWSSNSRWIAFSSKRKDGIFTRIYFSYVDDEGVVHKPFVLAQKDPTYYDSLFKVYQIPELTKSPIPVTGGNLARFVRSPKRTFTQIPVTSATPTAIPDYDQKWLRQE